jgi:hypothetical protein
MRLTFRSTSASAYVRRPRRNINEADHVPIIGLPNPTSKVAVVTWGEPAA